MSYLVLLFLLAAPPVLGANISLAAGECFLHGNDTICAPNLTINTTAVFADCISACNTKLDTTNAYISRINHTFYADIRDGLQTSISNLSSAVSRLQLTDLTDKYVTCIIERNLTNHEAVKWQAEAEQRSVEMKTALAGTVPKGTYDNCTLERSSAQATVTKKTEESLNFAVVSFIAGGIAVYWYLRRTSKDERDLQGGRPLKMGR